MLTHFVCMQDVSLSCTPMAANYLIRILVRTDETRHNLESFCSDNIPRHIQSNITIILVTIGNIFSNFRNFTIFDKYMFRVTRSVCDGITFQFHQTNPPYNQHNIKCSEHCSFDLLI